jgi:hypothetical protein
MAEAKEGAPGVLVPKDLQRGPFYAPYDHEGEKWEQVTWSRSTLGKWRATVVPLC